MWLYLSFLGFFVIAFDVVFGSTGHGDILTDVEEMLTMLLTTIFFVTNLLIEEKKRNQGQKK